MLKRHELKCFADRQQITHSHIQTHTNTPHAFVIHCNARQTLPQNKAVNCRWIHWSTVTICSNSVLLSIWFAVMWTLRYIYSLCALLLLRLPNSSERTNNCNWASDSVYFSAFGWKFNSIVLDYVTVYSVCCVLDTPHLTHTHTAKSTSTKWL